MSQYQAVSNTVYGESDALKKTGIPTGSYYSLEIHL